MTTKYIKIGDIALLSGQNCKIKDPNRVEKILNDFVESGFKKLQVVSDFDFTITKYTDKHGNRVPSTFGMLHKCKSLPPSFTIESNKLMDKYKPIEIDLRMPIDEKIEHMVKWWKLSGRLMKGLPLDVKELDEVASHMKDSIKDGTREMFIKLHNHNVPILVFSAGLGDSVLAVLNQCNIHLSNVKVISNFLQYKDGVLLGLDEDNLIHTFNKNETALEGTEYYDLVHDRDHIILMGDSIGDARMAEGVPSSSHILKIGFLFDHVEQNLPIYMNTFDIVLTGDETMDIPRAILKLMEQ